ncbi:hypothetical protein [Rhizobium leguminosarum]|uniref:hypothetical protein n=1 Tax=Rhizobium leguminosarum TaxID=384 RepID=UPI00103BE259|nr:hypothetical protein [Rhizobium leguminosarum]TCA66005.1 hypothetical protein E0H69_34980 [Rhizobium leguminosarum bv. viciae]
MDDPFYNPPEVEILKLLIGSGVDFVVVGGAAVQYHGYERPREDLDILVRPSKENARCFARAMDAAVPPYDFADELCAVASPSFEWTPRNVHHSGIHFLGHISGVTYDDARASAILASCSGLSVPIISLNNLIVNKRSRGDTKDLDDIAALTKPV